MQHVCVSYSFKMNFFVTMALHTGIIVASFVLDTTNQKNVTIRYIKTNTCTSLPVTTSNQHTHAICQWTSTIDDNINRIPQRIIVMDETQGLPSKCNINMTGNFTCEVIRRKMNVLMKTNCNEENCLLEEKTITVSEGLTCAQSGDIDDQERKKESDRLVKRRKKRCNKRINNKGKQRIRDRCRKLCQKPNQKKKICFKCRKSGK